MSEQDALTVGTVIDDRYRLISEGEPQDLGIAYKVHDLQEDRTANLVAVDTHWGHGQGALSRLQQVERSVTTLSAPGLIPYEHTGLVGEQLYLVYPQVEGQTLADLLARYVRINTETVVDITIRLCQSLAPAHRAGLTHGGLSPRCVVIREGAADDPSAVEVLVLDTGLLPALRPVDASSHKPWGRLPYISPEQASGSGIQPSSDVYVIGAMLYEMLIGRPPFRAADETVLVLQHLHQEPPSLQIMDTSISRPLAQIVYNALSKEPSARYRNAGQLAQILRAQVGPEPQTAQPAPEEKLVIPTPPAPVVADTWSYTEPDDAGGAGAWEQEKVGIDWVMIALLIAALLAVLGLIPLWRAVYSRYAIAPAGSSEVLHWILADTTPALLGDNHQGCQPKRGAELDEQLVVWYNTVPSRPSLADLRRSNMCRRCPSECSENAPSLGVQLTGQGRKA